MCISCVNGRRKETVRLNYLSGDASLQYRLRPLNRHDSDGVLRSPPAYWLLRTGMRLMTGGPWRQ